MIALRVVSGYRTVSADAALILARIITLALQASYLRRVFFRIRDLKQTEDWSRAKEKEIKEEEKVIIKTMANLDYQRWSIWQTYVRSNRAAP